jgi:hypothetical protein
MQAPEQHRVTLVAMPPSGEVFLARDGDGVLWLIPAPGAGEPERVDGEIVERAVVDHGFERVEESFATWALLDEERQRRAGIGLTPVTVDFERFDRADVERLLGALGRARGRGQVARARRFAHRLLAAPVLRGDDELYERVVGFLLELDEIPASAPPTIADEPEPERLPARARVQHLLVAA